MNRDLGNELNPIIELSLYPTFKLCFGRVLIDPGLPLE